MAGAYTLRSRWYGRRIYFMGPGISLWMCLWPARNTKLLCFIVIGLGLSWNPGICTRSIKQELILHTSWTWLVPPPPISPSRLSMHFANVLGIMYFGLAISEGASIIFSNRKFIWLPIGYSLALYGHRYLENGILPIIAEDIFHNPAYSRILVCGSNLGELVGALTVFLFGNMVPSPIPWLRLDACLLLLTWVLPFYRRSDPTTVYLSILPPTPPPLSVSRDLPSSSTPGKDHQSTPNGSGG